MELVFVKAFSKKHHKMVSHSGELMNTYICICYECDASAECQPSTISIRFVFNMDAIRSITDARLSLALSHTVIQIVASYITAKSKRSFCRMDERLVFGLSHCNASHRINSHHHHHYSNRCTHCIYIFCGVYK